MKWKDYEIYIARHFQKLFPDASIQHNISCPGLISKTPRQIDILIEQQISGFDIRIIVDCKYFNKKVDVKVVESFLSFLQDLKASKGVLITNKGYSTAAKNRATYDTQDIDLRIIDFKDLDDFQTFLAIPYQNSHCAIVSSPPGWVIDSRTIPGRFLASLYPAGLAIREGFHIEGFMYINFFDKGLNISTVTDQGLNILTLDDLLNYQNEKLAQQYTGLKLEYISTIEREDCICKLRVVDSEQMQDCNTLEYTLFMDYKDVVIVIVLLAPLRKSKDYLKKLEWIGLKLIKGIMLYDVSENYSNLN
jgi:Restriction endonuclease